MCKGCISNLKMCQICAGRIECSYCNIKGKLKLLNCQHGLCEKSFKDKKSVKNAIPAFAIAAIK